MKGVMLLSYENLMYISIGAGIVLLTISIIFFIYYRIPDVVSDLTGRTAKRKIEAMQAASRSTGKIRTRVTGKKEKSTAELSGTNGRGWLVRKVRKKTTSLEDSSLPAQRVETEAGNELIGKSKPVFQKDMSGGTTPLANDSIGTIPLPQAQDGTMPPFGSSTDTVPLSAVVASAAMQAGTDILQMPTTETTGESRNFTIKQRILVIHTEEQI